MSKYRNLLLWWFVFSVAWGVFRLLDVPEFFSEVIAKPIIWLGITAIFIALRIIPQTIIAYSKTNFTQTRPLWKVFILPTIFILFYFSVLNFRLVRVPEFSASLLAMTVVINFATGIVEEMVYRSVLYVWLLKLTSETKAFLLVQVLFCWDTSLHLYLTPSQ